MEEARVKLHEFVSSQGLDYDHFRTILDIIFYYNCRHDLIKAAYLVSQKEEICHYMEFFKLKNSESQLLAVAQPLIECGFKFDLTFFERYKSISKIITELTVFQREPYPRLGDWLIKVIIPNIIKSDLERVISLMINDPDKTLSMCRISIPMKDIREAFILAGANRQFTEDAFRDLEVGSGCDLRLLGLMPDI